MRAVLTELCKAWSMAEELIPGYGILTLYMLNFSEGA